MQHEPIQRRIKLAADKNGNLPSEIHLLDVGHWHTYFHGAFEFTVEDFRQFVSNFAAGIGLVDKDRRAPINYGHDTGGKAAGWIVRLFTKNNDTELWAETTWTPAGIKAIQDGEYAYISAEAWPRSMPWIDAENEDGAEIPNVLDGAAITNIPLFKKLNPLRASRGTGSSDNSKGVTTMDLAALRAKKPEDLKDDEKAFLKDHQADLTPEERKTFELQTEEDKKAEQEAADKAEAERKAQEEADAKAAKEKEEQDKLNADRKGGTEVEQLKAQVAKLEASVQAGVQAQQELRRNKLTASVQTAIKRGSIKSDQETATVDLLVGLNASQEAKVLDFIDKLPQHKLLAAEQGGAGIEASVEVTAEERALAADFGNTPEQIEAYKKEQAEKGL